jgi:hypothetical protein
MCSAPTTQSPAIEARRSWPLAPCQATNDVSMDALFEREVQFFVRRSGKPFKDSTETVNARDSGVRLTLGHFQTAVFWLLRRAARALAGASFRTSRPRFTAGRALIAPSNAESVVRCSGLTPSRSTSWRLLLAVLAWRAASDLQRFHHPKPRRRAGRGLGPRMVPMLWRRHACYTREV